MSALWAPWQAQPEKRADRRTSRKQAAGNENRRLRALPAIPERMARVPFITVLIVIFGVGMVGLLMVNTALQNQAFESRSLNRQAAQLVYQEAQLQSQLNKLRTPKEVAAKASALGMRANPKPAFLVVPSGNVIGDKHRVDGTEMKGLIVKSPAQLAAEKAAREAKARAKAEAAARKRAADAAKQKAQEAATARAAAQAAQRQQATAAARQKAAEATKKKARQDGGE